jgi:hypothetical protein
MKKLVVLMAAAAVLACSAGVSAQAKTNMLSTNPLGIIFGIFNLEYQKGIGDKNAIGISAVYWKPPLIDISIMSGTISYNIYTKSTFHGFFVKPAVTLGYASWKWTTIDPTTLALTEEKKSAVNFGLGADVGYRWLWNSGFSIGLGGGIKYTLGSYEGIDFGGVGPSLLFDLGWAF